MTVYSGIGDGVTDETLQLQAAIDAVASAGGGELVIPLGVYIYTSLTLRTNVDIVGAAGSVLKVRDHTSDANPNIAYYFIRANAQDNVLLRGLTFDGNQAANHPASPGASWVADILTITGDRIRVVDCSFVDAPDSGMMFAQCTNSEVSGCFFDNAMDLGIYYNDTGGGVARNNLIRGNRFTRCQYGAVGIKRHSSGVVVVGNAVRDCGNGITLEDFGGGSHPERVSIIGNRIEYIGQNYTSNPLVAAAGIVLNAAHGTLVQGNIFDDVVGPVISLGGAEHCLIHGNEVRSTVDGGVANRGITLAPRDSLGCSYNVISENMIRDVAAEAFVALAGAGDHRYNAVSGNMFQSAATDGVRVNSNWLDNDVFDNRIAGGGGFDLNINIAAGTSARNRWSNNRLQNGTRNGFVDVQTAGVVADLGPMDEAIGLSAPTIGTWKRGTLVRNYQPSPGGTVAWLCTLAGTPGTWIPVSHVDLASSISLVTPGQMLVLGDGVTSGNVGIEVRKADSNNTTYAVWKLGSAASGIRFAEQWDTSENRTGLMFDGTGTLHALRPYTFRYNSTSGRGGLAVSRFWADLNTTVGNSDWALSAAFGASSTVVVDANAKEMRGQVTITAGGAPFAANGTATLTFPNGTWGTAPEPMVVRNGGIGAAAFTFACTPTTLRITVPGMPTEGTTYVFRWMLMG